ncbi:DUF4258 domain-containing protein [Prosthecochloris marina]|nr:DUF4258 domain-containing protein [Prosthecochloris marina]
MLLARHCKEMLEQKDIQEALVFSAVVNPGRVEDHDDNTRHYLKKIDENNNKWLRIIVNVKEESNKCVTAFFDRRLRGKE